VTTFACHWKSMGSWVKCAAANMSCIFMTSTSSTIQNKYAEMMDELDDICLPLENYGQLGRDETCSVNYFIHIHDENSLKNIEQIYKNDEGEWGNICMPLEKVGTKCAAANISYIFMTTRSTI